MNGLQSEIERIGREIFARMAGSRPSVFSQSNVTGLLLSWSLRQEQLKTQLFRLIDVLPALADNRQIAQHIGEYLGDESSAVPVGLRTVLRCATQVPSLAGPLAGHAVRQIARSFILAERPENALAALRAMRDRSTAFTVDLLGEAAVSEKEAEAYAARYLELIQVLANAAKAWPSCERIDSDDRGPLPAVNISVKVSALYSQIKPEAPEHAIAQLQDRLRPLLHLAKARNIFINFDMELHSFKDLTMRLFTTLLSEAEFADYPHVGIAMQAYLRETPSDLDQLLVWAKKRGTRVTVRLVKGAYWDTESILARQRRWPMPVYEHKHETDVAYERLARRLLENSEVVDCAFATHNVRTIAACLAEGRRLGLPVRRLEFQMLYGMAEPIKEALNRMGYRVRGYCPLGETLPGMAYLVRRLLENTSNEGFLRAKFSGNTSPRTLLRDPATVIPATKLESVAGFSNEPLGDFSRAELREQMAAALREVDAKLGTLHPLLIGESEIRSGKEMLSRNPAKPAEIVGRLETAGAAEVDLAISAAAAALESWRDTEPERRAIILEAVLPSSSASDASNSRRSRCPRPGRRGARQMLTSARPSISAATMQAKCAALPAPH